MLEFLEPRVLLSRALFVAVDGDDANPGTLAQPFATIQKAATLAAAGDTVYIRGGTYHQMVTPAHSGTAKAPITFKPYNDEVVTVSGADPVSGWSPYNNRSIYQADQSWDLGSGNNQVFVDGLMMNEARWPNAGTDPLHWATAAVTTASMTAPSNNTLISATATITANSLPATLVGATVHIGAGQDWLVQTGTVLSTTTSPSSFTYAFQHRTRYEIPETGDRFYLTGVFRQLDSPGEWYRDPTTGKLYLWTLTNDSPTFHDVQAKRRQYAFELRGRSYINVQGIHLFAATVDTGLASNHLTLSSLDVKYVSNLNVNVLAWDRQNVGSRTGIILDGTQNTLINSTIAFSSGNGVWVGGSNNMVQNNTIHDVDYSGGDEAGITVTGSNQQIIGNNIQNTGRDGILMSQAKGGKINSNIFNHIGLLTTDLGAIYGHGGLGGGMEIAFNKIANVRTGGFGGAGVYLDNGSSGYIIHDNTVSNADQALKVNPPGYGNTIYNQRITFGFQVPTPSFDPIAYSDVSSSLTIFGSLGGYREEAYGINDSASIVGWSEAGSTRPAFVVTNGKMSSLGTLGGSYGVANAINASGRIVGTAVNAAGVRHAIMVVNGKMTDLGTLVGDNYSSAAALNASGQIVGVSYGLDAIGHAFLYTGGKMTALGTLGGAVSQAYGINDTGTIVGSSTVAGDKDAHAFTYAAGAMQDLGTLGGTSSCAFGLNNSGQIVGQSLLADNVTTHAFVDANGTMTDLGTLPGFQNSAATAINTNGDIVGYCYNPDYRLVHGFVYHNGVMTDLNQLMPAGTGWTLISATAINSKGQIVGAATDANLNQRAYVLSIVG